MTARNYAPVYAINMYDIFANECSEREGGKNNEIYNKKWWISFVHCNHVAVVCLFYCLRDILACTYQLAIMTRLRLLRKKNNKMYNK